MARVVAIVDSNTGTLIDAAGNVREGARYKKFAKRMLSLGTPTTVLDYGANGATKLEVSSGGAAGDEISLKARTVNISAPSPSSAVLKVNGKTLDQIVADGGSGASPLERIVGEEDEIDADTVTQDDVEYRKISLAQAVRDKLEVIDSAISDLTSDAFVRKEDLASALEDISFGESDSLDDVKGMLQVLVSRLQDLAGVVSS